MKKLNVLFISAFLLSSLLKVFAYDVVGHRIIARIAYDNLSDKAREETNKVLGTRGIIYQASWADELRSDSTYEYSYPWHYQNLKQGLTNDSLQNLWNNPTAEGEHLFMAIQSMIRRLKKNKDDSEALKFLVHFIGDLHQPLHLGREEDLGGNKIKMTWFGKPVNVHQVWDQYLIDSRKMSSLEYAQFLEDKFEPQNETFKKYNFMDAIESSYSIAQEIYSYDMTDTNPYHYSYHFVNVADTMLYRAGILLAKTLNDLYQ